jgi:nucleoside-diphosphate-sugar epimerase
MKVLFIGGTGNISTSCSLLAVKRGMDLTLMNRGSTKEVIPGARLIKADIRDKEQVAEALTNQTFDAVVDWIAFTTKDVERDYNLFNQKTKQFIFISSASAYQKPPSHPRITESTPLCNPYWEYSRNKIACEDFLTHKYQEEDFPITIVRPSHTYRTILPIAIGDGNNYTLIDRMKRGEKIIVHGDGTSLWTFTHADDFAKGFLGLLGNIHAIGQAFHITSDELLTWNQIYTTIADSIGAKANMIHIPSDFIAECDQELGAGLLGDKAHSVIFDNTKIKTFVPGFRASIPFSVGIKRVIAWFEKDNSRKRVDARENALMNRIIDTYMRSKSDPR